MTPEQSTTAFAHALALIRKAVSLALAPTARALDECSVVLAQALSELETARQSCAAADAPWPALKRELSLLGQLLAQASGFYEGWDRLRGALSGGYTASGEPPAPWPAKRLSTEA